MNHGTRPTKTDHRDYDFHKTFGSIAPPSFPPEGPQYPSQWMPDQNVEGEPMGCTNYASADLARNLTSIERMPADLDAVTHANELGGYDIRKSLQAAVGLGWFKAFYRVTRTAGLDWFGSLQLAQTSGAPEMRTITIGTPWFPSWEAAAQGNIFTVNSDGTFTTGAGGLKKSLMPMPTQAELAQISSMPWHDHEFVTWTSKTGQPLYKDKSWQGTGVGDDGGYLYFDRATINVILDIAGACAFTGTNMGLSPVRIDTNFFQWVISNFRILLGLAY